MVICTPSRVNQRFAGKIRREEDWLERGHPEFLSDRFQPQRSLSKTAQKKIGDRAKK